MEFFRKKGESRKRGKRGRSIRVTEREVHEKFQALEEIRSLFLAGKNCDKKKAGGRKRRGKG